ncbi:MAG: CAP domain-containing protein [Deltaproteobacteria bacterium]|nr:CAP domain-containing protein [Deltaproteobacteria bacterium]
MRLFYHFGHLAVVVAVSLGVACGGVTSRDGAYEGDTAEGTSSGEEVTLDSESEPVGSFSLSSPMAQKYSTSVKKEDTAQVRFSAQVTADGRLTRAARDLVEISGAGFPIMTPAIREVLWWHGIPEAGYEVALFKRGSETSLHEAVEEWLNGQAETGFNRYGIAMRQLEGGVEAAVISVKSRFHIIPLQRRVSGPRKIRVEGRVDAPYKSVSFSLTTPHGETIEPETKLRGNQFVCTFRAREPGVWQIEILGVGPRGPTALANFPVAVGVPVESTVEIRSFELESEDPEVLERSLFQAINRERSRKGQADLEWSRDLGRVARDYSEEMAKSGIIAHVSSISGSVSDRVRAASIKFAAVSENLARARTASEAHEGLMGSPAHRANILNSRFSEVGVGVALVDEGGEKAVIVTQIFTQIRTPIEPDTVTKDVIRIINERRKDEGRRQLDEDRWLARTARKLSRKCFKDKKPHIPSVDSRFKSVKVVLFKTTNPNVAAKKVTGLYESEQTHIGVGVKEGHDSKLDEEVVCVIVLLGRQ